LLPTDTALPQIPALPTRPAQIHPFFYILLQNQPSPVGSWNAISLTWSNSSTPGGAVIPGRPVPAGLRVPHGGGPGRRGPDASGPQPPRLPHPVQALAADADDGGGVDFGLRPMTICLPRRAPERAAPGPAGRGRRRPKSVGHYAAGLRSQRCRRTPLRPRDQNTTLHRAAAVRHQRRRPFSGSRALRVRVPPLPAAAQSSPPTHPPTHPGKPAPPGTCVLVYTWECILSSGGSRSRGSQGEPRGLSTNKLIVGLGGEQV
jgi:hypothetical protein